MATYDRNNTEVFTTETSWTVPDYVNEVAIECWGEDGGDGSHDDPGTSYTYDQTVGGVRGKAEGILSVSPGDTLYIRFPTGGNGKNATINFDGKAYSGDGGDAADVRMNGTGIGSVVIGAAGGGGGAATYMLLNGTNSTDADATAPGDANAENETVTSYPPDSNLAGEDGVFDANSGDSDVSPEGENGLSDTDSGTDNEGATATGGGGAGYGGGEAGSERIGDDSGTTYSRAPGGAGGMNDISGVTDALEAAAPNASHSHKVKIHWEEVQREVKVSESGSFQQRTIYVSDGSTFTQPKNLHRSDGSSWNSKY